MSDTIWLPASSPSRSWRRKFDLFVCLGFIRTSHVCLSPAHLGKHGRRWASRIKLNNHPSIASLSKHIHTPLPVFDSLSTFTPSQSHTCRPRGTIRSVARALKATGPFYTRPRLAAIDHLSAFVLVPGVPGSSSAAAAWMGSAGAGTSALGGVGNSHSPARVFFPRPLLWYPGRYID